MNVTGRMADAEPEAKLAALMIKDLGVYIDRNAMRLFILHRWKLVSAYAHQIHETEYPAKPEEPK